jgi:K+-transporting ATPase ATPase A chain
MSDTLAGLFQVAALLVLLGACYVPLGDHMARVFTSERHWRIESTLYRLVRVDASSGQRWPTYAAGVLGFSFVSCALLYLLQRLQPVLPASFGRGPVPPATAFNTAVSFVTNTNWQSYVPEQTLGDTVQMAGLTVQNVLSAAVGLAVAVALIRGFVRSGTDRLGNVWVDLTRGTVRILLPLAFVAAVLLLVMGVTMSLHAGVDTTGVDGAAHTLPLAPTASQEAI